MERISIPIIILFMTLMTTALSSCNDLKKKADLIIYNGTIFDPDSMPSEVNCIAVKDGRILAVGSDSEIRSRYWAPDNIDASGLFIYPGFTDAHAHFTGYAMQMRYADLSGTRSFREVMDILKEYRKLHPDGWILGKGWDQNKWVEKEFPDNRELNRQFPGIPVVLTRVDGHAVLASDAAIKAAGIQFPVKNGQAIYTRGRYTGVFLENLADQIRSSIPVLSEAEMAGMLLKAAGVCHQYGLTSVSDAGLNRQEIMLLDSLQSAGSLKLRIDAWMNPNKENFTYFMKDSAYHSPYLRVGAVKLYADGALGSRGACLLKPYADDPRNQGLILITPAELETVCRMAYEKGFQVNTHAIGDSAVRMVLRAYSKFLAPGDDRRWRIEHAQVVDESDIDLFGRYHIIPSVQATHATSDMGWAGIRLGRQRLKNAYAYKALLKQNGWIPNGTDFPVESIDPLKTYYAAVGRKDAFGWPEGGFQPDNALTREEALKSITLWAAKSAFLEKERGSLKPGMMADFTILNTDILACPENEILKAKVRFTIVGGQTVFKGKK
jgi:predicted amidohydrolase YtcJ